MLTIKYDIHSMQEILHNFHVQFKHAIEIGESFEIDTSYDHVREIVICGMGGSALGGNLLNSYLQSPSCKSNIKIRVNKGYGLPHNISANSLIIISSYSGNTEETLAAMESAYDNDLSIICLTSGGKVKKIANSKNIPCLIIPDGFQPRCALAYSFVGLLYILIKSKVFSPELSKSTIAGLTEAQELLKRVTSRYESHDFSNPAFKAANDLFRSYPVIYSADSITDSINLRWQAQIHENAKSPAFGSYLPEMNHNEINAWFATEPNSPRFKFIFLRDKEDHPRVKIRFDAIKEMLSEFYDVYEFYGTGNHILARMFDLIYLGDWLSYYLAVLNKQDPISIPVINRLKEILAKHKS
ncbi:MAG: bifunctional phosphoglucose/phosphomannose isomerase [Ignavibacteriae bacterium HGW-Ignavibacteriae-1]|jgi:glucose/mannose-6-phosphate isomerase|nr:MAG: bifunctional phosphoglucose/phosphomannose isomerase [Ignavibacteriae bacterium HGW-Ignavibacteriae-1]